MLLTQTATPLYQPDGDMQEFYAHARRLSIARTQSLSGPRPRQSPPSDIARTPIRHKTNVYPSTKKSTSSTPRLSNAAKQHVVAVFTDNWRDDIYSRGISKQRQPMQATEDDHDGMISDDSRSWTSSNQRTESFSSVDSASSNGARFKLDAHMNTGPAIRTGSFLELMRTAQSVGLQRRQQRGSWTFPNADIAIPSIESDISSDYDTLKHINTPYRPAYAIQQEKLQPLRRALRTAATNSNMRKVFSAYGPSSLDPKVLMEEVLRRRQEMMAAANILDSPILEDQGQKLPLDFQSHGSTEALESMLAPERNDFDEFLDLHAIEG